MLEMLDFPLNFLCSKRAFFMQVLKKKKCRKFSKLLKYVKIKKKIYFYNFFSITYTKKK